MGDQLKSAAPELNERIEKGKLKRARLETETENTNKKKDTSKKVFFSSSGSNVLTETEDLDSINYRPKTRESRIAYEEMLSFIQTTLGDQPQDILRGAADEILAILKDESLRDPVRMKEIDKILPRISSDKFGKFVALGKKITDFKIGGEADDEEDLKMDEEMGVAVVFDDDDEEEDVDRQDGDEVHDSEDDEEEGGVEAQGSGMLKGGDDAEDGEADESGKLLVHDIDAHWLQRQLSKFYSDANFSSRLAEETLAALQIPDERVCENRLVVLLDYDKFDFIKLLLQNKSKIYYCTRLRQAQSEAEVKSIEDEMKVDITNGGALILEQLRQRGSAESWTKDRIGEFANKARREARALNKVGVDAEEGDSAMDAVMLGSVSESAGGGGVGGEKILDLDGLQFSQGAHLMANKRCELPEKSWRAQKKGYEEVHVPAVRPILTGQETIVDISELPVWAQPAFAGVRALNRIQSKMVPAALFGSDNILLCAPTGAGKTNVALLCMLNQIGQHLKEDGSVDLNAFKIVYVAPMKALVQECVQSFGKRLEPFGINVRELSGDQNLTRAQIQDTQVIITTPEKWDIVTRKSGDRTYTQLVRLIIIDEIHLLHDDRGPVIEALVARTLRQIETTQEMVRLVGLSATLPNFEDVATFLRVNPEKGLFYFDHSFRPVPLQQQYIGVTEKKALKRFQLMNEICYEKVLQQAGRNQVLIFTHSRAETAKTARALRDLAVENDTVNQFVREDSASLEILKEEAENATNPELKDLLPQGFAIHHAGMVKADRKLVEDLFADKHVQVLVSTATLAWGVNLPCHTVIIKGTQMYSPEQGRWVELSPLDIMQMMGRAGRYGLDSEGEGIIMTQHSELQYYLSLMNQQLPIESQMIKKLPDNLNAEVVLGNVLSVKEAAEWLGYTYLFVRMMRNPSLYGVSADDIARDPTMMQRRTDLAHTAAAILDKHNLIKYDRKSGNFQVTALGRVASHYYVSHDSIRVFNEYLKPSMSEIEIFRLFSLSGEFKHIHVREEEKIELLKLVSRVPIPIKEGVEEPSAKVNVLLQAFISRLKLEGFALAADMTFIQQSACRLMRALFEIALKRNWAALAEKTLTICKMVEKRTWGSQSPLRQFAGIPEVVIRKLEKNSDLVWERYYDLKPQDLGEMVKIPKMGKTLHKYVHMFPKLDLSAHVQPITRSLMRIDLTITPDFQFDPQVHEAGQMFWVLVEDVDGEKILHFEPFLLKLQYAANEHVVSFSVPLHEPLPPQYFIKVISDRWLHAESVLPVSFRHLILPQKYPPPTELLDLRPLPVSALGNKAFERLFKSFGHFNPIQTQTFSAIYEGEESVLVCAPTGSGKTVCAEFALLRLFATNPEGKCVYIAPKEEIAETMFGYWETRFGDRTVVKLTGDTALDLGLLEAGNVIVATAVHWDALSRKWKQRKSVQNVALYIADELHLIGGPEGPTLEVVLSRARYIASQLERRVRIVALASSLANAKDIGDWLGITSHHVFNFSPDVRPVPIDIRIFGFDASHFGSRLLAMAKPVYNSIVGHSPDKPVIVFVPSRKQAQLSAIDIMTFAAASGKPNRFLRIEAGEFAPLLASRNWIVKEPALADTLSRGVGFLHSGLTKSDRHIVEELYRNGVIGVLVCPHGMCWSVPAAAHLVIIMDTVYYEGKDHRYVDCSITDILQMIGQACRPTIDEAGQCIVLCQSPKKEYLKKLLHDPLPVESHLDHVLHENICAEVVSRVVENKQDAVDYLTWTFFYKRINQNPNYYSLQGVTHRHISDHLSELVETTITDLQESKCLTVDEDFDLSPLNLGMISSHYYIQYTTVELFASSVTPKTKLKGLIEILAASSEFAAVPMRQGEEQMLLKLAKYMPATQALPEKTKFDDPATKALVLMLAHFSRHPLPLSTDLAADLRYELGLSIKLIQALVDVISSEASLRPALAAMELSQMLVQGIWEKQSVLLQIPYFNAEIIARCRAHSPPVDTVFDVLELDDEVRDGLLSLSPEKMSDVATFCNAYPNIEMTFEHDAAREVPAGDSVSVVVTLRRDVDEEDEEEGPVGVGKVVSQRFPGEKTESWWLVVGNTNTNSLLSIKRVAVPKLSKVKLEFTAPEDPGDYNLVLYLMSDSYLGCDQEYELSLTVVAAAEGMDDEDA